MAEGRSLDPLQAFAELGRVKLGETDFQQLLLRVTELAKQTVPGAAEVSVTLLQDGTATTAAFTGDMALQLDEKQYDAGYGPCLDAAKGGGTLVIGDMKTEERWPDYTPRAVECGALSSVSVGLPEQQSVSGALNVYGDEPQSFPDAAVELVETFAGYAAVALANARLYESTAALAAQMEEAMSSRAVIEQAKGLLVGQTGCTPDRAFDMLSKASQDSNRKLRDIAQSIVDGASKGNSSQADPPGRTGGR
jgi:GAF domain-containing protein